ncbi:hypothetical protein K505DRAFT_321934, partial [Melanomma pulvis-pyrius CBS 109.77]
QLATASAILYYACWPLLKLCQALLFLLAPVWTVAQFVLLPITSLAHALLTVALFPFRLHLLDRLETIYIYLGIAALIGCIAGAILHFSFSFLSSTLSIDAASESRAHARARTAAAYRAARSTRKAGTLAYTANPAMLNTAPGSRRQRGVLSQTIIEEEEDSDF